jgi:hypothetical protein
MKKSLLLIFAIALIATGCSSAKQSTAPSTTQNNPSASSGPMPAMTYKVASQQLNQYGNPTEETIDLYTKGNKIGSVEDTNVLPENGVSFFAGNNNEVFFSIQQDGIGDRGTANSNAYQLNLQNGAVTQLVDGSSAKGVTPNSAQDFDITPDFDYLSYVTIAASKKYQTFDSTIERMNINTGAVQSIPFAPNSLVGVDDYITNIRTSPDQTKIAVAVEVPILGVDENVANSPQIWIVDIKSGQATLYQKVSDSSSQWVFLTGWKDSSTPQWVLK